MAFLDGSQRRDSVVFLATASLLLLCSCVPSKGVDDTSVDLPSSTTTQTVQSSLHDHVTYPDSSVGMLSVEDQDRETTSSIPNDDDFSVTPPVSTSTLSEDDKAEEKDEEEEEEEEEDEEEEDEEEEEEEGTTEAESSTPILEPEDESSNLEDINGTEITPPLARNSLPTIYPSFVQTVPATSNLEMAFTDLMDSNVIATAFMDDSATESSLEQTESFELITGTRNYFTSDSYIFPTSDTPYLSSTAASRNPKLNSMSVSVPDQQEISEIHSRLKEDQPVPSSPVPDTLWTFAASDFTISPTAVASSYFAISEPSLNYSTSYFSTLEENISTSSTLVPSLNTINSTVGTVIAELYPVTRINTSSSLPNATTSSQSAVSDSTNQYFLVLGANCPSFVESEVITAAVNRTLMQAGLSSKVHVISTHCSTLINVNLTVDIVDGSGGIEESLKAALRNIDLKDKAGGLQIVSLTSAIRDAPTSTSLPPTEDLLPQEVIAYIVVGVLFGILLLAAIVVVCAKCVCRRQNSKMELYDLPHVTLNVEDYKLTTIPRPSLVYTDCNRDSAASYVDGSCRGNGFVQGDFQENSSDRQLKTFGRRKPYNGSQVKSDPGAGDANATKRLSSASIPIADKWSSNDALTSSTNISDITGIENPNYRKWF